MHLVKFILLLIFGHVVELQSKRHKERQECSGMSEAVEFCHKILPGKNAQHMQNALNESFDNPMDKKRKKENKQLELIKLKKQNEYFSTHNNELRETIGRLNEIVRNMQEIYPKTDPQQCECESEKEELKKEINDVKIRLQQLEEDFEMELSLKDKALNDCQANRYNRGPTSCNHLSTGIHDIQIDNKYSLKVLCNNDIAGGGWLVILNRFDGSEKFYRPWDEYLTGFGNLNREFFIGLENLHRLTKSQQFELYVQYKYFDDIRGRAHYDNFRIDNEMNGYTLKSLGHYNGTDQEDPMTSHNLKQKFTTYDQDNDKDPKNCAKQYNGAWWFKSCTGPNPLARYSQNERANELDAMSWNGRTPLKSIQMFIRAKQ